MTHLTYYACYLCQTVTQVRGYVIGISSSVKALPPGLWSCWMPLASSDRMFAESGSIPFPSPLLSPPLGPSPLSHSPPRLILYTLPSHLLEPNLCPHAGVCMGVITALTLHLYRHSSEDRSRSTAQAAVVWALYGVLVRVMAAFALIRYTDVLCMLGPQCCAQLESCQCSVCTIAAS